MLADFYIPRLSNDMKIAVQKNYLVGQILNRSLVPSKKRRLYLFTYDRLQHKWLFVDKDEIEKLSS